jgi:hypothetical protein
VDLYSHSQEGPGQKMRGLADIGPSAIGRVYVNGFREYISAVGCSDHVRGFKRSFSNFPVRSRQRKLHIVLLSDHTTIEITFESLEKGTVMFESRDGSHNGSTHIALGSLVVFGCSRHVCHRVGAASFNGRRRRI